MEPTATIVCIGELLWNVLPDGRRPGGAPFSTAAHLRQLGQPVQLISRVGDDELGRELLTRSTQAGISTGLIQRSHTHLTGVGKTTVRNTHEVIYRLVEPVAWDYLEYTAEVQAAVRQARLVVYGSVLARNAASRETLYRLLPLAAYRVFDVNLCPPHYSREVVKYLLRQADLVKLSGAELREIMGWLGQPADEASALPWLAEYFGLQTVCVTHGAQATLWAGGQLLRETAPPTPPAAPGGSDAFLATLLAGLLAGQPPAHYLRRACAALSPISTRLVA